MNIPTPTGAASSARFKASLGDQLIVAHGRLRRRRRRRQTALSVAAVLVVALLATTSLSVFDSRPASAGPVTVETNDDGSRIVRIEGGGALPEQLEAALRENNVKNTTTGAATGPSRVGSILAVRFDGQQDPRRLADSGLRLDIPSGFDGHIDVVVGRAAAADEPYSAPTDAFAAREPLAGLTQRDVTSVAEAAARKRLRVTYFAADGRPLTTAPAGATVGLASMISATELLLRLES